MTADHSAWFGPSGPSRLFNYGKTSSIEWPLQSPTHYTPPIVQQPNTTELLKNGFFEAVILAQIDSSLPTGFETTPEPPTK